MCRASARWARARHLFGPFLMQSPNARFLHGPFLVGYMDRPLSIWEYGLAPFRTEDEILEYLLAVSENLAHPLHLVYNDGSNGGVQWWEKRCNTTSVHTQADKSNSAATQDEGEDEIYRCVCLVLLEVLHHHSLC